MEKFEIGDTVLRRNQVSVDTKEYEIIGVTEEDGVTKYEICNNAYNGYVESDIVTAEEITLVV